MAQQTFVGGQNMPEKLIDKIKFFLRWQVSSIRRGGVSAFVRKVRKVLFAALTVGPALLVVLTARALRPLVVIRFGKILATRIGHFAANTELYLSRLDIEPPVGKPRIDLFYYDTPVSNEQLKKMWGRFLRVSPLVQWVDIINRRLPGGKVNEASTRESGGRDIDGLLVRTQAHLVFTSEEERRGRAGLEAMGVPGNAPFICFHARDSAYLDAQFEGLNWSHHDYRDCDIKTYLPAVEAMTRRGYYAVRMGAVVKEPLSTDNPKIIDYGAGNAHSDFLDIYLGAKCRFFIVSDAGIYGIPAVFRRPIIFVNFPALEPLHTWHPDYISIPKMMWSRSEGRLLAFREILESGVGKLVRNEALQARGIEVVDNTPEEIAAVVDEMDRRIDGTWVTTEEDEELQRRFWSLFKGSKMHGEFLARVGADFLRRHRELL